MILQIQQNQIGISVRNMVEFLYRSGNLTSKGSGKSALQAMQAGSRIHKKIQRSMGADYQEEVSLKKVFYRKEYQIELEGRADGIFPKNGVMTIDEIKGTYRRMEDIEEADLLHKAQALCYAYLYSYEQNIEKIGIQITYCHLESEEIRRFYEEYEREEIESWMDETMTQFFLWSDLVWEHRKQRNDSIQKLKFPFEYRAGQKALVASVYTSMKQQQTLFLQAPTGIGKSIATIYPTLKWMAEYDQDKFFYLTAKTITRTVANETFALLRKQRLSFHVATITAKEKICFQEEMDCDPEQCPYAKGHYDRMNRALYDCLMGESLYDRETIEHYASMHQVCPYELSLDLCNFMDGIICDYNYVFDPTVQLKRFFGEGRQLSFAYLVDEAHNLVDRAREMYSATLCKEDFLEVRKKMPEDAKAVRASLSKCNKELLKLKKEWGKQSVIPDTESLIYALLRFTARVEQYLEIEERQEVKKPVLELYFQVQHYLNMYEMMDDGYEIYGLESEKRYVCKLFCMNPQKQLKSCFDHARSVILFSATLLPISYYKNLLTGNPNEKAVYVPSPFDLKKRKIFVARDVSSRYNRRSRSEYEKIFWYLDAVLDGKKGNYLVFLPSYEMLEQMVSIVYEKGMEHKADLLVQTQSMTEEERETFLHEFEKERKCSLLAFCVIGGIFSEGINLIKETLIGVVIVGNGFPGIGYERDLLKEHFDKTGNGFDYAYRYPGFHKVLQAAGRVIRTQEDEGIILLLEERLLEADYQKLFPREWQDWEMIQLSNAKEAIRTFWKGRTKQ